MAEKPDSRRDQRVPDGKSPVEPAASENPEGSVDPAASVSLLDQLEAARAERDANYDLYLRTQAELQTNRRRTSKEMEEMRQYQSLPLARDLLPALDNLHRALAAAENGGNVRDLANGVRMVAQQIETAFGKHQIVPIEAAGKPFDTNLHHAIQQMQTSEYPPMTVMQEVERGFKLNDRVVRPATVIVAAAPAKSGSHPAAGHDASSESEWPNADV